jgi:hypothetical protein
VGILAAVAIPAFFRYLRTTRTGECPPKLKKIFDEASSYFETERTLKDGSPIDSQFPNSVEMTPDKRCCKHKGGRCFNTDWSNPTWHALDFAIDDPHHFQYAFISTGTKNSAMFTARAQADLDCDNVLSTYERAAKVVDMKAVGSGTLWTNKPIE